MKHAIKLLKDKTLVITVPARTEVDRVLVEYTGTQVGSLFYPEPVHDVWKTFLNEFYKKLEDKIIKGDGE